MRRLLCFLFIYITAGKFPAYGGLRRTWHDSAHSVSTELSIPPVVALCVGYGYCARQVGFQF